MKSMKEIALQCKHTGGKPLVVYDATPDKTYIINEQEAQIVRTIFEMYAAGKEYSEIINKLNQEGYKTQQIDPLVRTVYMTYSKTRNIEEYISLIVLSGKLKKESSQK